MAGRRGFRRLTAVCSVTAAFLAVGAWVCWFVLRADLALYAAIGAGAFAAAAWVSHGFASE